MTSFPPLPDSLARHLPGQDRTAPRVQAANGLTAVAGAHALFFVDENGPRDSGMWYEVQYGTWDAATRQLTIVWADQDRLPTRMVTEEENPEKFMRVLTSRVDRALVVSRQIQTPSGAVVTASVRRRVDGALFSTVLVQGNLVSGEEPLAAELERRVRAEVGLD